MEYTAKITDVKRLRNILDVCVLSVCCRLAVLCIGRRMFLCTICVLEHACTNRQPNICAHTVDKYNRLRLDIPVEWLIFQLVVFSRFFPRMLSNGKKQHWKKRTMQYMSALDKHGEILTLVQ